MKENTTKLNFDGILDQIEKKSKDGMIQVRDVDSILDAGFRLSMEYKRVCDSRAKWRARAETAEELLKPK